MKKIIKLGIIVILLTTLVGCQSIFDFIETKPIDLPSIIDETPTPIEPTPTPIEPTPIISDPVVLLDIQMSSNITVELDISGYTPFESGRIYAIGAPNVEGYVFEHWIDEHTQQIVSLEDTYTFLLNRHRQFKALYIPSNQRMFYVYSNIDADITYSIEAPYELEDEVTLTAQHVEGYRFKHWYDAKNQHIMSNENDITLIVDMSFYLIAVYEHSIGVSLYLEEGFEDSIKTSYADGIINTYGKDWFLSDALVGSLANDQKDETKSIRLRNGYIETLFGIKDISSISFFYGKYLSDANSDIFFDVSFDQENWIRIETLNATQTFNHFTYTFDDTFFTDLNKERTQEVFFRISSPNSSRVNIDLFQIYKERFETPKLPSIFIKGDDLEFPNNSQRLQLSFDASFQTAFNYQETWHQTGCVAIDIFLGNLDCQVIGSVNTSYLGIYQITYYALDQDGFYASQTFTKVVLRNKDLLDFEYSSYYQGIKGLYGLDLIIALRSILNEGVTLKTYADAREILEIADKDPNQLGRVLTIYDRQSVIGPWDTTSWHREHVWPNSRLGISRVENHQANIGSDLHNLRAIVPSVNSSRGNKVFGNTTTADTYFPGYIDKGDVARILFYMILMWEHLELVEDVLPNDPQTNYKVEGAKMSVLSWLIKWHFEDPVDGFELHRNQVIYTYQNNRNPLIDYPHLVELIFFTNPAILQN